MIDKDILGPQMESVSPEVVQLININSVPLVADEVELPVSNSVFLSADQSSDPFDFVRFQIFV